MQFTDRKRAEELETKGTYCLHNDDIKEEWCQIIGKGKTNFEVNEKKVTGSQVIGSWPNRLMHGKKWSHQMSDKEFWQNMFLCLSVTLRLKSFCVLNAAQIFITALLNYNCWLNYCMSILHYHVCLFHIILFRMFLKRKCKNQTKYVLGVINPPHLMFGGPALSKKFH